MILKMPAFIDMIDLHFPPCLRRAQVRLPHYPSTRQPYFTTMPTLVPVPNFTWLQIQVSSYSTAPLDDPGVSSLCDASS